MPSDIAYIQPMNRHEATACLADIRHHLENAGVSLKTARARALELYQRQGWKALGYPSFKACAKAEFNQSFQHLYRLRSAALVDEHVQQFSPAGDSPLEPIPTQHTRHLAKLGTPEQQYEAYTTAKQIAAAERRDVTGEHVRQAVQQVQAKNEILAKYAVVAHMVTTGELGVEDGKAMTEALDKCKPKTRGYIVQLIGKFGLTCPALIPVIAERYDRQTVDDPSRLLQMLERTGRLGDVLLRGANLTDWQKAVLYAQAERIADRESKTSAVVATVVTLYAKDPARSMRVMRKEFGAAWLEQMVQAYFEDERVQQR